MELHFEPAEGLSVLRVEADGIVVGERTLVSSFLLTPERIIESWPPNSAAELDAAAIDPILRLEPELVILGSGSAQVFPDAACHAAFLGRGVGFEVMDNAAAARTFNLLAAERRRVVGAFLLLP